MFKCSKIYTRLARMSTLTINSNWKAPAPCQVGDKVGQIDTPCMVVDMNKLEQNLTLLPEIMKKWPSVAVRPHAKAHKTPALAALQIKHGAVGVCCQTLVEAEAMVYGGGITDILVSNQLIGKKKLRRLAALAKVAQISICVDDIGNIRDISDVCEETGTEMGLVVEVDVGQGRCGVEPGKAVIPLVQEIQKCPKLYFKGLQCYEGLNQHVRMANDRAKNVERVVGFINETLKVLSDHGIECKYVTGGGTGTFQYEAGSGVFNEVQPGSYALMDADYGRNYGEDGQYFHVFSHSLFVLTTVQSVREGQRAVVDAGMKAISMDSGVPKVADRDDLIYHIGGDEHGILKPSGGLKVGDLVKLIPGHCDPTANLHDWMVGIRGDVVETVWPVMARNAGV